MSDTTSVHLVIRGRVQGVFFRAWTRKRAEHHGVDGWVRNRADGAVEAVISGERAAVEALVSECRRGPLAARVDGIDREPAEAVSARGFVIAD